MGGEVTGCLEPARGWESVLGEQRAGASGAGGGFCSWKPGLLPSPVW